MVVIWLSLILKVGSKMEIVAVKYQDITEK